jgi:PHP family Zn ribbon phosphoesterase
MTTKADPLLNTLKLPGGARFYKCALQVNPHHYSNLYRGEPLQGNAQTYAREITDKAAELGISVLAVTDHNNVSDVGMIREAGKERHIHVLPGFEIATSEGVHVLCIYPPDTDKNRLGRYLGEFGIRNTDPSSHLSSKPFTEVLRCVREQGGVTIAAHATTDGGLFKVLSGQPRIRAWKDENLLAVQTPGPVEDLPQDVRSFIENKNADYRRSHVAGNGLAVAVVNARDVAEPGDLEDPSATCWIKMSEVSIEGLRQAFLDPGSRIRLNSAPAPEDHTEFVAITWQGGFLDGQAIHFNENLNVLIGGRGTGKSTVVESLRYVLGLEPLGEEARKVHEGIVRHVLMSGTKISVLLRSHRPNKQEYRLERTFPNPPVVRDQSGSVLNLTPSSIVPQVDVFGQHEISELTRSPEKLTRLLDRFVERDAALDRRKADVRRQLEQSRGNILDTVKELASVEERLATLPAFEETLKRFQQAGLEERLKEQSLLVREEHVLRTSADRLAPYRQLLEDLRSSLPIDRAFVSRKALDDLPGKEILEEIDTVLSTLNCELDAIAGRLQDVLNTAEDGLASVRTRWEERKKKVQAAYEKILRELQKSKVDGEEFIRLRHRIEELRPLRERETMLQRVKKEHESRRRQLLVEWEDMKAAKFRQLERAAKKVSKQLSGRVRVRVTFTGNREPLYQLLRDRIGGQLAKTVETLEAQEHLSLAELADCCRSGTDALRQKFNLTPAQAKNIVDAQQDVFMLIEELDLPHTTSIELNVAGAGAPAVWQALEELSTGQKATAVLFLLLLESDAPLVVDQPEDDLDNRFITEGVVPKMREEKRYRQFILATHNANIPVLGDAELIVGLTASGEAGEEGRARMPQEHMGSIDARPVQELVEEVLEGGRAAFEMRRLKYGF